MVILIGNQKGGAGKSTFTLLLANYLTQVRGCTVTVIDMDYQQSLVQKFAKDQVEDMVAPYQVIAASLEQFPVMLKVLGENPEDLVLIDLPGKLDDDGLISVFQSADLVYCPFGYDAFSFESTVLFACVLRKINPQAELTFIPNRVKSSVRYELRNEVDAQLAAFGSIAAAIPDRIDFQRVNTMRTPVIAFTAVQDLLDHLFYSNMAFLLDDLSYQRLTGAVHE